MPEEVKRRRNNELLAVQNAISEEDNQPFIGREVEVLVEGPSKAAKRHDDDGAVLQLAGRTHCDRIVVFDGNRRQIGQFLAVTDLRRQRLHAVRQRGHRARRSGSVQPVESSRFVVCCLDRSMHIDQLHRYLDEPAEAAAWLRSLGVTDLARAHANLVRMATAGVTLDLLAAICDQFAEHLPRSSDPDMALNNLERFVAAARNPLSLASLFERDREALPILLQIFSTSQYLSDLLITDSESYDLLRMTEGQPVARDSSSTSCAPRSLRLADDEPTVDGGLAPLQAPRNAAHRLRRHHSRPAAGHGRAADLVPGRRRSSKPPCGAARRQARRSSAARRAARRPSRPASSSWRWASSAACELNYSSDIDLIFLYDADGEHRRRPAAWPTASSSTGWRATCSSC